MSVKNPSLNDVEDIELDLYLRGIYLGYGYDFRNYSRAHMKRRVGQRMMKEKCPSILALTEKALKDPEWFHSILSDFSINVTEMFRDPEVFAYIRSKILVKLSGQKKIKIWHAGCSTGEEVYSLAIFLKELGLYDKSVIYASDFDRKVLAQASQGIYKERQVRGYEDNYKDAGGVGSFMDYFDFDNNDAKIKDELKKNIIFLNHNLVSDLEFDKFHLVFCRNVLIYFNRKLQNKVISTFTNSIHNNGYLILGTKETVEFSEYQNDFSKENYEYRVFQKKINRIRLG